MDVKLYKMINKGGNSTVRAVENPVQRVTGCPTSYLAERNNHANIYQ